MNNYSKQAINKRLFTSDYDFLIKVLKQITIEPNKTIPVELVRELSRVRREINQLKQPIFTKNGVSVMKDWEEYKYTGLNNVDYVNYSYWIGPYLKKPYKSLLLTTLLPFIH